MNAGAELPFLKKSALYEWAKVKEKKHLLER